MLSLNIATLGKYEQKNAFIDEPFPLSVQNNNKKSEEVCFWMREAFFPCNSFNLGWCRWYGIVVLDTFWALWTKLTPLILQLWFLKIFFPTQTIILRMNLERWFIKFTLDWNFLTIVLMVEIVFNWVKVLCLNLSYSHIIFLSYSSYMNAYELFNNCK